MVICQALQKAVRGTHITPTAFLFCCITGKRTRVPRIGSGVSCASKAANKYCCRAHTRFYKILTHYGGRKGNICV